MPQEFPEGLSIKSFGLATEYQSAVPEADRSEVPHAFSRRVMKYDWIFVFWWNPHAASRSLLLEMDFIERPEIHSLVFYESSEFFLWRFCRAGSPLARTGRGLRRRKSMRRNRRWH
jgi:hypothetical protein